MGTDTTTRQTDGRQTDDRHTTATRTPADGTADATRTTRRPDASRPMTPASSDRVIADSPICAIDGTPTTPVRR